MEEREEGAADLQADTGKTSKDEKSTTNACLTFFLDLSVYGTIFMNIHTHTSSMYISVCTYTYVHIYM